MENQKKITPLVVFSLAAVYVIWSFTYLAIKICVSEIPPFIMNSVRFITAGGLMLAFVFVTDRKSMPTMKQLAYSSITGALMFMGGTGFVALAMQTGVGSGLSAVAIAAVTIWAAVIGGFFGKKSSRFEWAGVALGFAGIIILKRESDFMGNTAGMVFLLLAPFLWALGSFLVKKLEIPGGIAGNGSQMLMGGITIIPAALLTGEKMTALPGAPAVLSLLFLIFFGSIAGFTAYMYLFKHTSPALATSYSYVNPFGAVLIGVIAAGETIGGHGIAALFLVVAGIGLIIFSSGRKQVVKQTFNING